MPNVPHAGEEHGEAGLIRGRDFLVVIDVNFPGISNTGIQEI